MCGKNCKLSSRHPQRWSLITTKFDDSIHTITLKFLRALPTSIYVPPYPEIRHASSRSVLAHCPERSNGVVSFTLIVVHRVRTRTPSCSQPQHRSSRGRTSPRTTTSARPRPPLCPDLGRRAAAPRRLARARARARQPRGGHPHPPRARCLRRS